MRTVLQKSKIVLAGIAGALAAAPLLTRLVPNASARDPWILVLALRLMAALAALSASGPARRALGVHPIRELRHE